jgi:hypothetical protein
MCHKVFNIDHHRDIVKSAFWNRDLLNAHARCLQSIILGVQLTNVLQPQILLHGEYTMHQLQIPVISRYHRCMHILM